MLLHLTQTGVEAVRDAASKTCTSIATQLGQRTGAALALARTAGESSSSGDRSNASAGPAGTGGIAGIAVHRDGELEEARRSGDSSRVRSAVSTLLLRCPGSTEALVAQAIEWAGAGKSADAPGERGSHGIGTAELNGRMVDQLEEWRSLVHTGAGPATSGAELSGGQRGQSRSNGALQDEAAVAIQVPLCTLPAYEASVASVVEEARLLAVRDALEAALDRDDARAGNARRGAVRATSALAGAP